MFDSCQILPIKALVPGCSMLFMGFENFDEMEGLVRMLVRYKTKGNTMKSFSNNIAMSQGRLLSLRVLAAHIERPIVLMHLEKAALDPYAQIVEYAHFRITTDAQVSHFSSRYKPNSNIENEATLKHGIADCDVASCQSFKDDAQGILDSLKGALVIGFEDTESKLITITSEMLRAGLEVDDFRTIQVMNASKYLGFEGKNLLDLQEHAVAKVEESNSAAKVMLISGILDARIFNVGARSVTNALGLTQPAQSQSYNSSPNVPARAVPPSNGTPEDNKGFSKAIDAPEKRVGSLPRAGSEAIRPQRQAAENAPGTKEGNTAKNAAKSWLHECIKEKLHFPVYSQSFLIEKMRGKREVGYPAGVAPSDPVFGFEISEMLKSGELQPAQIVHSKVIADLLPVFASSLKSELKLSDAQKKVESETGRSVDYPILRAALMVMGHVSYPLPGKRQPAAKKTAAFNSNTP